MPGDDLNEPLGRGKPARRRLSGRAATAAVAGAGLVVVAGIGAILVLADPHGGEPYAVAPIAAPKPTLVAAEDRLATGSIRAPGSPSPGMTADAGHAVGTMENGVTVYRATKSLEAHDGPLVIKVPEALGQSEILPVDRRLIEESRYGPLPKIAADGARASEVYARPPVFAGTIRPGAPRIALVIGGLGLSAAATRAAIEQTPAAVTLAFAPYGDALDEAVKRAKADGHEVLLQLPMEGFGDAAATSPGPHTLALGATPRQTIDDLHWLMSRMGGYVGVSNFLGARFTADKEAMTTTLQEIGARGLLYLDDGTSGRSLAAGLAPGLGVPAAHVDVVLDGTPATLRTALLRLEAAAREKGSAIGMASDRPDMLGPINQFAAGLEGKGIALVPVSALAGTTAPAVAVTP